MNIKYLIVLAVASLLLFISWPKESKDVKIEQDILTSPICPGDPKCCIDTQNNELDITRK